VESDDLPGANKFVVVSAFALGRRLGGDRAQSVNRYGSTATPHRGGVLRADSFPSGEQIGPLNQFPKHAEIFSRWGSTGKVEQCRPIQLCFDHPASTWQSGESGAEMTAAVADAGRDMKIQ